MKTVMILLSTYNGEKYIKPLIESILNQKNVNIQILVRDDGSKDKTVEILESYNYKNIRIIKGNNIGPQMSFLELVNQAGDADYYAYCDQDDVWYENKLERAVLKLEEKQEKPALYISTYDVVNDKLEILYKYNMHFERELRLEDTLLYRAPSACNMVFNKQLCELIKKTNPDYIRMHDFWTLLIAEVTKSEIITDDISGIMYRQHADNTVAINANWIVRGKRLLKSALTGKNERLRQAKNLLKEKETLNISGRELEVLNQICFYKKGILPRWRLAFDKKYLTRENYINILFKVSVLLGIF